MSRRIRMAPQFAEIGRFIINGIIATLIHYSVLRFNLNVLGVTSAGLANFFAAWFGIVASFLGNRYFVFRRKDVSADRQAVRFLALYLFIACTHGLLLFAWTDKYQQNYTVGFLLVTALLTATSYLGNRLFVFTANENS